MHMPPEPLTPPDCNLQDFPFMPLDVQRLRDSKLTTAVKPDRAFFAVILWCASWHQVPAASLPDDDAELAKLAGFGFVVKEWKKYREGALYGWIKCSDGRLYHPVVAEKARDAWAAKHEQRYKTECARIKKHNQRHGTEITYPTLEEFVSPNYRDPVPRDIPQKSPGTKEKCPPGHPGTVPRETASKGQGEGQGEIKEEQAAATPPPRAHVREAPSPAPDPAEPAPPDTAVALATTLRAWERARGKFAQITAANAAALAELAPSDAELREAYDLAVADRDKARDQAPVNAGFVAAFVAKIRAPARPRQPQGPPWWSTDALILAKGRELGIEARPGESMGEFKGRIQARMAQQGQEVA